MVHRCVWVLTRNFSAVYTTIFFLAGVIHAMYFCCIWRKLTPRPCYMRGDRPYSDVNGAVYRPWEDCIENTSTLNMTQVIIFGAEQNMHLTTPLTNFNFFFLKTCFSTLISKLLELFCGNHYFGNYSHSKFVILHLYACAQHYFNAPLRNSYLATGAYIALMSRMI